MLKTCPARLFDRNEMDVKQIRYFIAVAEKGSISAAAASLRIAQPALSSQIANLETDLRVQLFLRHGRGVTLTSSGQMFLEHAYRILEDVTRARDAVTAAAGSPSGEVTIGIPMTTANILAVPIVELMRDRFPAIDLHFVDGMSGDILAWLLEGRLDLAVLYESDRPPPVPATPLVEDDLYLIGDTNEQMKGRTEIDFEELRQFSLFHTSRAHALRPLLDHIASRFNFALKYDAEIDSIPQIKALVFSGAGYSILPKIALGNDVLGPRTQMLRVVNPDLRLRSSLAAAPRKALSGAARQALLVIPEVTSSLVAGNRWPGGRLAAAPSETAPG
jgi:LysR family transcriptional regulator, nitrogen assimilation regulatory protein